MSTNLPLSRALRISAGVTAALLLLPVIGMQVSDQVSWGPGDFLIAGVLLFGALLLFFTLSQRVDSVRGRWIVALAVMAGLALVWAELAVGIFS